MSEFIEQLTRLLQLDKIDNNPDFSFVERKLGVKPSALTIAIITFLLIVTLISNATNLVIAIGCCCVPIYFTFIALEGRNMEGLKKYLIYWIIYAIMEVIGPLLLYLLSSTLYILVRIALAVALLHP